VRRCDQGSPTGVLAVVRVAVQRVVVTVAIREMPGAVRGHLEVVGRERTVGDTDATTGALESLVGQYADRHCMSLGHGASILEGLGGDALVAPNYCVFSDYIVQIDN